jgi:hypothetical protein
MARGPLAGASGPGKFSKRTDLPSAYYGEGVETAAIKSGAPLATTPDVRPSQAPAVPAQEPVTPLFAPTQRPDEPITAGIDRGPGAGSEALMMNKSIVKLSDTLAAMLPYDTTGEIAVLYQEALSRGN